MENSKLFELNFSSVLGYDQTELKERGPQNRYDPPFICTSVCTKGGTGQNTLPLFLLSANHYTAEH
jgi:hypothetical protein